MTWVRPHKRNGHHVRGHRRRSPNRSKGTSGGERLAVIVGGVVVGLFAVVTVLRWLISRAVHYWYVSVPLLLLAGACVVMALIHVSRRYAEERARQAELRYTLDDIDAMTPTEFEVACRDLLRRDGLSAEHCGGRGDRAVDVKAGDILGRRLGLQCKHTTKGARVGPQVLRELNGALQELHKADIGVVVTNGGFTRTARQETQELSRIHLIDREELEKWAERGKTLIGLLGLPEARPKPPDTEPST